MSGLAGDLISAHVNHPELGSHTFYPKANESTNINWGGIRANDDESQVSSGGMIPQLNRVRASFEFTASNDDNIRMDAEFAGKLSAHPLDGEWTFTHLNAVTYGMTGRPVGEINPDLNAGTFTLKVAGLQLVKVS